MAEGSGAVAAVDSVVGTAVAGVTTVGSAAGLVAAPRVGARAEIGDDTLGQDFPRNRTFFAAG